MMRKIRYGMMLFRAVVIASVAALLALPAALSGEVPASPSRSVVSVLGYEHFSAIGEKGALSPEAFARQMDYLVRCGLTPISPQLFLAWRAGLAELPPHAVLLTLEEAETEVYESIFPLLRERGIPFLLFLDERNLGSAPRRLNPSQIREMQRAGAVIGCASATRPAAYEWQFAEGSGEAPALTEREIGAFGERLRAEFGECACFSYPHGYADGCLTAALAQHEYQAAFCRAEGKVSRATSAFRLPRTMVRTDEGFSRAVNFGEEAESGAILARLNGRVAEVGAESVDPVPAMPDAAASAPIVARCGALIRREGGDWETESFAAPVVPREQTRVAVLGYHHFSNTKPVSEMLLRTSEFCCQMQYIRDAGLSVITMEDFLQWLRGSRRLPERCVLITLDDGWKSVYTDAYPILRAYGYPFTMFLYTKYIQVQGDSLTRSQITEMQGQGATVGSHSTSHLYPKSWKRLKQGSEAYAQLVEREILLSRSKLSTWFGSCSTYCFPGGYNTPPMLEALRSSLFRAAFTVLEGKITVEEDPYLVHRYMVFGTNSTIFRRAVNFDGQEGVRPTRDGIRAAESRARAFFPAAFPTAEGAENAAPDPAS